jgi:hypothetical protein
MPGSIWVFLLLASEAIKTYKANPHLEYVSQWALPILQVTDTRGTESAVKRFRHGYRLWRFSWLHLYLYLEHPSWGI